MPQEDAILCAIVHEYDPNWSFVSEMLYGIPALINATIAPSREFMQGECAQALQENAMCALANISGGLSYVISSLGQSLESCSSPTQIADTLGAIASTLIIYDNKAESTKPSDPLVVEETLLKQFKPRLPFLTLCKSEGSLWRALQGREGVQLLISLIGLSSEQQQECAVALLCLLSNENDESKWVITAAGGIPPLVQILETGSAKAKEDSARILKNLCNYSEDIRACVESANAVPALLWLLKNGSPNGDLPESKVYVLDALRSMLSVVSLSDLLRDGSAAGDAINTMIKLLSSTKEETQAKSTSVLSGIFETRKDVRESNIAVKTLWEVDYAVNDCVNRAGTVLALVSSLESSINESVSTSEALEALAILSRSEETGANVKPTCAILAKFPQNIIPMWKKLSESNEMIDENWLWFYWQQILRAVNTIHEERIVPSNLKPANFLQAKEVAQAFHFAS
ncbi:hypothetical protein KIW84_035253 [Lathyrus oleraceus]|uniref:ARM repeat superfamily protein n=1 Tax=Pisum sativum TaxID=3888 RepID=A0A9D5B5G9_PEA|nr:hypothetical protein KIW84_035253 [Pisum sativum]